MLAIALAIWGVVGEPYVLCVAMLAAAPIVALLCARFFEGGAQLTAEAGDMPGVGNLLVLAPLILAVRALFDFRVLDVAPMFGVGAAIGIALLVATVWASEGRPRRSVLVLFAVVSWIYGASVSVVANGVLATSQAEFFRTEVLRKHETERRRASTYVVHLAPPLYPDIPSRVEVGEAFYAAVQPGDEVCLQIRRGALGWRFWEIGFCPA